MELFTHISSTRWWHFTSRHFFLEVFICVSIYSSFTTFVNCDHTSDHVVRKAKLNINTPGGLNQQEIIGTYCGDCNVNIDVLKGQLIHVHTKTNQSDLGCGPLDDNLIPFRQSWIALIRRGDCNMNDKVYYAGKVANASAVIIYDHSPSGETSGSNVITMIKTGGSNNVTDVIALFISYKDGIRLIRLLENSKVNITISNLPEVLTTQQTPSSGQLNNTSVLFVSISFIVLIIISLAWLIFYYIQRCRYTNAKERLSRRLTNAAKKAIAKIPQRPIRQGDKELESEADQCAVCIEPYKVSDVIRILPCKHIFHKSCVDPWLLDQRNCPMCKMDILRAFGMHLNGSQESVPQDVESGLVSSGPANEDTEHASTSEERGAVSGVKIVLYPQPVGYLDNDSGQFHEEDSSSFGSLDFISTPEAQSNLEQNKKSENSILDGPTFPRSVSLESLHISDKEFNEIDSLLTSVPMLQQQPARSKLQRKDSVSVSKNSKESVELLHSD